MQQSKRGTSAACVNSAHRRVGRAKADSASRTKAVGATEDPTKISARRTLEGMAIEAVEIARRRSFTRSRISTSGGAEVEPGGRGARAVDPATASDHYVVDMDRVSTAANGAGGALSEIVPKPIKWRAVGAETAAMSAAVKGVSPRQNKVLQI